MTPKRAERHDGQPPTRLDLRACRISSRFRQPPGVALFAACVLLAAGSAGATSTALNISQIPLSVAIPAHPQVVIALGNSQSMDGNLSGAIMTGSGSLGSSLSLLQSSGSPLNYTVPSGFIAPIATNSGGATAPYTATSGSYLVDNSPSRLNVAKAGISAVLSSFMQDTDFGLIDYKTSGLAYYTTWAYYMSPSGGFTFTASPGSSQYVTNPCMSATGSDSVSSACSKLVSYYGSTATSQPYMLVSATSDDPSINDVLYAGGISPVCVAYGGPSPASPYPPNYSLSTYNSGTILETYSSGLATCALATSATNAGYVPYATQTMSVERGFGYYTTSETANDGAVLVKLQSAGATPTASSISTAIAAFTPYLAPETNSASTTEIKSSATQSPVAGLLTAANTYFATNPASSNGCTPKRYVLLITDGLPTLDLSGYNWPPLGSAAAAGYGVTATFNTDGSLNTTNDQALTDAITVVTTLRKNGVLTYVVGLGAGVDPSVNPSAAATLTALANAGGTNGYFAATSPAALTSDLQVILATILQATESGTAPAVSSTSLHNGSVVYEASFKTNDTYQDWTGDLAAWPISSSTATVNSSGSPVWSAQTALDVKGDSSRWIATWDPVTSAGIPFEWTSGATTSGISSSTALGKALMTNAADTSGQHALLYLRGNTSLEPRNGGPYRNRTHLLGDIVDSSPLYVGSPAGPYLDGSYLAFSAQYASRSPLVYVGANDGMLHAFDATTGSEQFAYVPSGVFANLINLTYPYYNEQHHFYVDGSPQAADVQFSSDGSWHTVLAGGLNAGGNTLYALDISNPSLITSESTLAKKVLWEITDTDMGLTFSQPTFAKTSAGFLALAGNGYNSSSQLPYLYAIDPQTGAIRQKLNLCSLVTSVCDTTKPNGLSSVIAASSSGDLTGYMDVVYAGDLQGNLWRVDISSATPSGWTVTVLFQARDSSGNAQPITTAPVSSLNPSYPRLRGSMVYVATGQLLAVPDLGATQTQTVYGVYDSGTTTTPITRASLVAQTLTAGTITISGSTVPIRYLSNNTVSLPTSKGWYVDLIIDSRATGERVITNPRIDSGSVIVTTNSPASNSCVGGNTAWLLEFNYATGGSFPSSHFDTNGDGFINSGDLNAAGIQLSTSVYASSATVVSGNLSNGYDRAKILQVGSNTTKSFAEKGTGSQRAWREIR